MKEKTKNNLMKELRQLQMNLGILESQLGNLALKRSKLKEESSRIESKKERLTHRALEIQTRLRAASEPKTESSES